MRQLSPGMACSRAMQEQLPRVLGFPFPLRLLLASQPAIMGKVLGIVYRAIATHLTRKAGYTKATARTGAVTLQTLPDESDSLFSSSVGETVGFSLHAGVATTANERHAE